MTDNQHDVSMHRVCGLGAIEQYLANRNVSKARKPWGVELDMGAQNAGLAAG